MMQSPLRRCRHTARRGVTTRPGRTPQCGRAPSREVAPSPCVQPEHSVRSGALAGLGPCLGPRLARPRGLRRPRRRGGQPAQSAPSLNIAAPPRRGARWRTSATSVSLLCVSKPRAAKKARQASSAGGRRAAPSRAEPSREGLQNRARVPPEQRCPMNWINTVSGQRVWATLDMAGTTSFRLAGQRSGLGP